MQSHRRVALPSGSVTATPTGFEPATSAVTGRHSNQAELRSHKHNTLLLSKSNATDEVHLISATKIQYNALTRQFKSSACRAGTTGENPSFQEPKSGVEPEPVDYETTALPAKLQGHKRMNNHKNDYPSTPTENRTQNLRMNLLL